MTSADRLPPGWMLRRGYQVTYDHDSGAVVSGGGDPSCRWWKATRADGKYVSELRGALGRVNDREACFFDRGDAFAAAVRGQAAPRPPPEPAPPGPWLEQALDLLREVPGAAPALDVGGFGLRMVYVRFEGRGPDGEIRPLSIPIRRMKPLYYGVAQCHLAPGVSVTVGQPVAQTVDGLVIPLTDGATPIGVVVGLVGNDSGP